jgi:uncharacterized integral membrane protein (TIGR00697 family)
MVVPAAVFIYALTFTLIDLVNERLGKVGARHVVYSAFAANILLAGYTLFALWLPPAPWYGAEGQAAFPAVLGSTWRMVVASLTAYIFGSRIDVHLFAWWQERAGRHRGWVAVQPREAATWR